MVAYSTTLSAEPGKNEEHVANGLDGREARRIILRHGCCAAGWPKAFLEVSLERMDED